MNCHSLQDRLALFVSGDLDSAEASSIRQHCASCENCRTAVAALERIRNLLDTARTPPTSIAFPQIYAAAARRQETRLRRWRRASLALAGMAAALMLIVGLKMQIRVQANEFVMTWNGGPPAPVTPEKAPDATPIPQAEGVKEVTPEQFERMRELVYALAANIDNMDRNQKQATVQFAKQLEALHYGDTHRWQAMQRDVAALYAVCLSRDKGGMP